MHQELPFKNAEIAWEESTTAADVDWLDDMTELQWYQDCDLTHFKQMMFATTCVWVEQTYRHGYLLPAEMTQDGSCVSIYIDNKTALVAGCSMALTPLPLPVKTAMRKSRVSCRAPSSWTCTRDRIAACVPSDEGGAACPYTPYSLRMHSTTC